MCWNPWGHKGSDTTEQLTATVWKLSPKICRQQAGDAEEPVWFQPKYGQAWDPGRTSISFWVWRWEKGQQLSLRQLSRTIYFFFMGGSAFYSGLELNEWGPPTLEREIYFTQTTNFFFFFPLFLAKSHSMWDLSSQTRDWTPASYTGSTES